MRPAESSLKKLITNGYRSYAVSFLILMSVVSLHAQDKKELTKEYKNKFVVVLKEGLAVSLCPNGHSIPDIGVTIADGSPSVHPKLFGGCTAMIAEPIHKGEVLKIEGLVVQKVPFQGPICWVRIVTVSPHSVERGVGAFAHQSSEIGSADITFKLTEDNQVGQSRSLLSEWFKLFDTQGEAAAFGNTASGIFVKHISVGMTFADVESSLGVPVTRIDLTDKVLYKYKDMTIEFRDGKVSDVR